MKLDELKDEDLRAAKLQLENQRDALKPQIMAIQAELDLRAARESLRRKLAALSPAEKAILVKSSADKAGEAAASAL